jgi:hypothetical protein
MQPSERVVGPAGMAAVGIFPVDDGFVKIFN